MAICEQPIPCPLCGKILGETEINICRRCRADPFPDDTKCLRVGFKIHARPRVGPAVWQFGDTLMDHDAALELAGKMLRARKGRK